MNDAPLPQITSASVKVMRSYDYCHFEVVLGHQNTIENVGLSLTEVDNLRKAAARLVDKAVLQYKVAKVAAENRAKATNHSMWRAGAVEKLKEIAEENRTPEQKAEIKAYDDAVFRANRPDYDYEDDWDEEPDDE